MGQEQPILIIGGTRGTGLLIARLLQRQSAAVRVFARNRDRALNLFDRRTDIVAGDLTMPETLSSAIEGVRHIIFTAGCRSGYPATEAKIKAVEYQGVLKTIEAAQRSKFRGRFLYMTSSGVGSSSLTSGCLNVWKGSTLVWRKRAEDHIRGSDLAYTIIRTGILLNRPGAQHPIEVTQQPLPLSLRYRIARADVATIFVAAIEHPKAIHSTFEIVWSRRRDRTDLAQLFDQLKPDCQLPAWE